MRLMPATSASSRREREKKRGAKTALPPWRSKSPSTRSRRSGVSFTYRPHFKTNDGRARERDARGPEHHAEEDDQVPVVLDQGIDIFHTKRSIRITAAPERLSELTPEKSYSLKPQVRECYRRAFISGHPAENRQFSVHAGVSVVLLWTLVDILRKGLYTSIDGGEGFVWAADRGSGSWHSGMRATSSWAAPTGNPTVRSFGG